MSSSLAFLAVMSFTSFVFNHPAVAIEPIDAEHLLHLTGHGAHHAPALLIIAGSVHLPELSFARALGTVCVNPDSQSPSTLLLQGPLHRLGNNGVDPLAGVDSPA